MNSVYDRAIAAKMFLEDNPYKAVELAIRNTMNEEKYTDIRVLDIFSAMSESEIILGTHSYQPTLEVMMPSTRDVMTAIEEGRRDIRVWDSLHEKDVPVTKEGLATNPDTAQWFVVAL